MKDISRHAESLWEKETSAASARLAKLKAEQKPAFESLKPKFTRIHGALKKWDTGLFLTPKWAAINAQFEEALLPDPPFSFTRTSLIKRNMYTCIDGRELKTTLKRLRTSLPEEKLKELLLEDYVGDPILFAPAYMASHNALAHLRHLVQFSDATGQDTGKIETVIEWGGGYGSLAKIFTRQRLIPGTYIIIDSPIFSCLQWIYLSAIFGEKEIHLVKHPADSIKAGKINLLPLCFLTGQKIQADLFIATWALCESSLAAQDYILSRSWFQAKNILLAYQTRNPEIPAGDRVHRMALDAGAKRMSLGGACYYAFR